MAWLGKMKGLLPVLVSTWRINLKMVRSAVDRVCFRGRFCAAAPRQERLSGGTAVEMVVANATGRPVANPWNSGRRIFEFSTLYCWFTRPVLVRTWTRLNSYDSTIPTCNGRCHFGSLMYYELTNHPPMKCL